MTHAQIAEGPPREVRETSIASQSCPFLSTMRASRFCSPSGFWNVHHDPVLCAPPCSPGNSEVFPRYLWGVPQQGWRAEVGSPQQVFLCVISSSWCFMGVWADCTGGDLHGVNASEKSPFLIFIFPNLLPATNRGRHYQWSQKGAVVTQAEGAPSQDVPFLPCAPNTQPWGTHLCPTGVEPSHFLAPDAFSQCPWQEPLVNLCFKVLSNFTKKRKKKKGSLPCILDGWVPLARPLARGPPPPASLFSLPELSLAH